MSETKQEPWTFAITEPKENTCGSVFITLTPHDPEIRWLLYGGEDEQADRETIARARLIVAAPDLLAACKAADEFFETLAIGLAELHIFIGDIPGIQSHKGCGILIKGAIAKATGATK